MRRKLTPKSSLDGLKREAKRWLKALRANEPEARARLRRANPAAPQEPALRDVQHALALEHGFPGWNALKAALGTRDSATDESHTAAILALISAANRGERATVTELLDQWPDIVSERGILPGHTGLRTALHFAVGRGDEDTVKLLLDRGADPNVRDEGDNAMPLHFVAEHENLPIIRLLIEHGADPIGEGDDHELEVIGWATCFGTGRRDVADYLLAHGARHNIFSAVAMGDRDAIRANAAQIDRVMDRANNRRRALHLAVVKKRPESLATLLDLGADIEAVDASGLTPLDQAALAGEREMAQLLIDRGARVQPPAAIALERTDDIERLLRAEPGSLEPGGRWGTLIVRAAERSTGPVIEALIRAGASVNAIDSTGTSVDSTTGYTALHAAGFFGNVAAVAALMKHGANVRARDGKYGGTPAGWANYRGHRDICDFIHTGAIDPFEAINADLANRVAGIVESDPGSLDRRYGEYTTTESNDWPDRSFTPLMWAAAKGNAGIVRILVGLGADASLRDSMGRTAFDLVQEDRRAEMAAILRPAAG